MMCKVLIFGCIAAVVLMTAAYGAPFPTELSLAQKEQRLKASIIDLGLLKDFENNFLEFYTPNDKLECSHATLVCFLKELNVSKQDMGQKEQQHVTNIQKNLEDFKDPNFSNPTCKSCESHEKKKFPEFHREMTSFLQSMLRAIV